MNTALSKAQIDFYNENGYLIIEDFLTAEELEQWRHAVTEAVRQRNGLKMPGKTIRIGEDDGINEDAGTLNMLPDDYLKTLHLGDLLDNDEQTPLIYKS